MNSDRLLTPNEVARQLGIKPQTLAVWRTNQKYSLAYVKVGRLVRYRESDVSDFIQRRAMVVG